MQRLQTHLDHFRRLDDLAQSDSYIHRLHPAIKIITTLAFLITVASYSKYEVSGLLPLILFPVALITLGHLPLTYFAERLLFLTPFIVIVAIANPFLDRTAFLELGGVSISGGWVSFAAIVLRFFLAIITVLALVATTGINDICSVLMRGGVPRILVLQLLLLYRYLSLLLEEAYRLEQAYFLRSGATRRGVAPKVWGSLAGNLLIRTFIRAKKIYDAMLCRGFTGDIRLLRPARLTVGSVAFLAGWMTFIVYARIINIPVRIGTLFKGVWG